MCIHTKSTRYMCSREGHKSVYIPGAQGACVVERVTECVYIPGAQGAYVVERVTECVYIPRAQGECVVWRAIEGVPARRGGCMVESAIQQCNVYTRPE